MWESESHVNPESHPESHVNVLFAVWITCDIFMYNSWSSGCCVLRTQLTLDRIGILRLCEYFYTANKPYLNPLLEIQVWMVDNRRSCLCAWDLEYHSDVLELAGLSCHLQNVQSEFLLHLKMLPFVTGHPRWKMFSSFKISIMVLILSWIKS